MRERASRFLCGNPISDLLEGPVLNSLRPRCGGRSFPAARRAGVDYVFANSGTDFPPIIEGLAEAAAKGVDLP